MLKTLVKFYFSKLFLLHSFVSLFFPFRGKKIFPISAHTSKRDSLIENYIYIFLYKSDFLKVSFPR